MVRAFALFAGLVFALVLPAQERAIAVKPLAERRVALLIGNDRYAGTPLKNAVNDAQAMGAALKDLGFEVEVVANASRRDAEHAVDRFMGRLGSSSVGLFFYAGHGIQVEGENYLLGVDFAAATEEEAKYQGLPASLVMDRLQKAGVRLSVVILDACRDNPFRQTRGGARGWATMSAGKGSFIAFATAPGQTASDEAQGPHGLFTACLLDTLKLPDLDLEGVFKRTREQVVLQSKERQVPWTSSSVVGKFVFWDLAVQERRLGEEKARLEAELATLGRDQAEARRRLGEAEALRREQELKEGIRLKSLEQARLAQEAERRSKLQAKADAMAEADRAQNLSRQRASQEEALRLAGLRQRLAKEQGAAERQPAQSLEEARAQAASLRRQIQKAKAQIATERGLVLAKAVEDLKARRSLASRPLHRGEFEKTVEYEARMAAQARDLGDLDNRIEEERNAVTARFDLDAGKLCLGLEEKLAACLAGEYLVGGAVLALGPYSAENGQFPLTLALGGRHIETGLLKVPPDLAPGIRSRAGLLKIRWYSRYTEAFPAVGRLEVEDALLGTLVPERVPADAEAVRGFTHSRVSIQLDEAYSRPSKRLLYQVEQVVSDVRCYVDSRQVRGTEFELPAGSHPIEIHVQIHQEITSLLNGQTLSQSPGQKDHRSSGKTILTCRPGMDYQLTYSKESFLTGSVQISVKETAKTE